MPNVILLLTLILSPLAINSQHFNSVDLHSNSGDLHSNSEAKQEGGAAGPHVQKTPPLSPRSQLLGKHKFQLHWISWNRYKDFADLTVVERQGKLLIKGRQQKAGDYLEIDGFASQIEDKQFTFEGSIVTRVSYKNNGNPCRREGTMTFKIVGKRRYWRLQEMQSPCDETTDYVDIFLR